MAARKRSIHTTLLQERSEERRKSKRFRGSSSVTSTLSDTQDGTAGPSLTPTVSGARASPRSHQTTFPSSRPVRAARLTRAAMAKEMSSGDLEGAMPGFCTLDMMHQQTLPDKHARFPSSDTIFCNVGLREASVFLRDVFLMADTACR